ncbi:MAG TPA: hypothetical protein PKV50_03510, partial [Prolixibacteraceae bacterium]|nr:hypothetical protein [Prolixibacteraceae bacterium]
MKKSVLKIAAIFMALLTIHLQTFATSAGTTSSENDVVVNYDDFHTGPLTGNPNTSDLGPSYPIDFMLKFMDGIGQLQEFKFLPQLISETYIS